MLWLIFETIHKENLAAEFFKSVSWAYILLSKNEKNARKDVNGQEILGWLINKQKVHRWNFTYKIL